MVTFTEEILNGKPPFLCSVKHPNDRTIVKLSFKKRVYKNTSFKKPYDLLFLEMQWVFCELIAASFSGGFIVFRFKGNPLLVVRQEKIIRRHNVLLKANHGRCNQMLLIKSVRTAPETLWLSTGFFHLSIIKRRLCCGL